MVIYLMMIIMKNKEIERLNSLSEKAIKDIATPHELKEFKQLLAVWNESIENNTLQDLYMPNSKDLLP